MSIDPDQVTAGDIDIYENLMKGSVAVASSNATTQQGRVDQDLFVKHTWKANSTEEVGPIEIKFANPTSLVSLNLDLNFTCQDTEKLIECLNEESDVGISAEESKEESLRIDTSKP